MESAAVHKFLHDLNNYVNAAMLNAFLLRRLHGDTLDSQTMERLESALRDADKITKDFQVRVQAERSAESAAKNFGSKMV